MSDDSNRIASISASLSASAHATAVLSMQMRYAVQHLLGAASFSRRVGEIEAAHANEQFGPFFDEILHTATACVFLTVASVEALANELFVDRRTVFPGHPEPVLDLVWPEYERKPVLDKFDLALALVSAPKVDRRQGPGQGITALVSLRNALVHFKPEFSDQEGQHAAVSKRLHESHRSPFLEEHEDLFPRAWASHACTRWAIERAIALDAAVAAALGTTPKYQKFAGRLGT